MGVYRKSQARKREQRQRAFLKRKEGYARGMLRKLDKEFAERLKREP